MNIKTIELITEYVRKIESIGDSSALFNVRRKVRGAESNNHFCYCDKDLKMSTYVKLPLDVAIRPYDSSIEYISFFIKKGELLTNIIKNNIIYSKNSVLISDQRFNSNKFYIDEIIEFEQYIKEKNIYVISKTANIDLIGYRLDDDHYILFDKEDKFSGVVFKNLTDIQMNELKKSNVL